MLSATWFASNERATATATALNFNQIGIAVAFLVGGHMAKNEVGIHDYFGLITLLCAAVTVGTLLQFQNKPPTPPSYSEIEKLIRGEKEPPLSNQSRNCFPRRDLVSHWLHSSVLYRLRMLWVRSLMTL